ncbi:MAG: hypoxanthine phosphoribosyltransferase [Haloplasmataceae bacterium]|jgi:hypoxanthine phosphoribosyltransferase|nr:hypoxanthine phosphoribosyltransferase [Haloplasmataceae bacterium]
MLNNIKKVLVSEEQILEKCKQLGQQISKDYEGKNLIVVGLLKGCVPFMSDLTKNISIPIQIDYMQVSSYHGGTESTGNVKVIKDLDYNINGLDVLIAEDIVDTGKTLKKVMEIFNLRGVNSIKIVTLLDKPEGRVVELIADYVGFTIPKEFVVGYGLDFDEYYRNLPFVGVLKEEVYSK